MNSEIKFTEKLLEEINAVLEAELSHEFDEAIKRFQDKKDELCARVLLNVHREVSFNTFGQTVTFTIKSAEPCTKIRKSRSGHKS